MAYDAGLKALICDISETENSQCLPNLKIETSRVLDFWKEENRGHRDL